MVSGLSITKSVSPAKQHSERLKMTRGSEKVVELTEKIASVGPETNHDVNVQDGKPPNIIEVYPDGGRGWLVCFAIFLMNFAAWGSNLALSIYMLHYITSAEEFAGLPRSLISLISGSSLSVMLLAAPFSNYIENLVGIKACVGIGAVINSLGLYLASLSTKIVYLILSQAILAGIGRGLIKMSTPSSYVLSQWFKKRCTLATGICHIGSGLGGVVFAYMTNYFIENYGLNTSYHANNILSIVLSVPCVILISSRCPTINADTGKPVKVAEKISVLSIKAIRNHLAIILFVRAFFTQLIFSVGMAIGRPIMGLISDTVGVTVAAIVCESIAFISYYALWLPSSHISMIAVHSFIQGSLGGVFFLTALPISMLIAPPKDVRSVVTVIWLVSAFVSMFSLYISLLIVDRTEADGFSTKYSYHLLIYFNSIIMFIGIIFSVVLHVKIRKSQSRKLMDKEKDTQSMDHDVLSLIG